MSEYENTPEPRSRRMFLNILLVAVIAGGIGWYYSKSTPSFPSAGKGEVVYELKLTPL